MRLPGSRLPEEIAALRGTLQDLHNFLYANDNHLDQAIRALDKTLQEMRRSHNDLVQIMQKQTELMREVVDNMPDQVFMVDPRRTVVRNGDPEQKK